MLHGSKRDGLLLFFAVLAVYWATFRVPGYSDPVWNTATAVSVASRGTADISPFVDDLRQKFPQYQRWLRYDGDRAFAKYTLLTPICALPFFWPASLLGMTERSWAVPYLGKLAASFYAALSVVFLYLAARHIAQRRVALTVALVYALCTATFSVSSQALFQHGVSQFFLALALHCFFRAHENRKALPCMGIFLALSVWARPLNILLAAAIFVYAVIRYRKGAVHIVITAGLVAAGAAMINWMACGSPWPAGYGEEAFQWDAPLLEGILIWLVSPGRGLLVYSPVFLFSIAGIILIWRSGGQGELRALTFGVALMVLVAAKWHSRGGGYGYRLLSDLSVPMCLFLVPVLARLKGRLPATMGFCVLAAASFLIHGVGAATFFTGPPDVWRLEGGRLHCAFRTEPKLFDLLLDSQMDSFEPRYTGLLKAADGVNRAFGSLLSTLVPFPLPSEVLPYCRSEAIGPDAPPRLQNVILVSIDSLRADHLGCYGYPKETSPNLDAFSRSACLFEQAITQAPWTLPAHASLLTAKYPITHGVDRSRRRLAGTAKTLAVWLKEEGYYTGAVVSGPFMKKLYGFDRGFHEYDDELAVVDNPHSVITSPRIHEKTVNFLDRNAHRPFFLFLHLWDVHYDYNPPAPYVRFFDPDYRGSLDARDYEHNNTVHAGMDPRDLEHLKALYDGEIRLVDEHLGMLFKELKRRKLMRETLFVITADHGDEFFEHGGKGHSHSLYEELAHVPPIIRCPGGGGGGGRRIDRPVALIDVAPTVLDLVGFDPARKGMEGRSLKSLMEDQDAWRDVPIWSETRRARKQKNGIRGRTARAMRLGRFKGIHYEEKGIRPEIYEQYDLEEEPGEQVSLRMDRRLAIDFPDFPERLSAWVKEKERKHPRDQNARIDPKTLEILRSLGYIGD